MHGNYPQQKIIHPEGLILTDERAQESNLDNFPFIDRSLIKYSKYHNFIGHAGVKHSVAVQATRGCPYKCFYCDIYKTTKLHFRRSDEHLFSEIKMLSDCGIKRIEFIDDIFNVNKKAFIRFFEYVLASNLKMQFYFPTGLKGDLLDEGMIDLMVEGGTVGVNLSLEHASPRMQKVMRKGLDVEKLRVNLDYITSKHPSVILTLNAMHGFPSETEDEARLTLDFILNTKWIDFPYLHNVRIFPGTELEHFALEVGVPQEMIDESQDMSYHEHSPTLPFSSAFSSEIRTIFLRNYVLDKERIKSRVAAQLRVFTIEELNQKYNSYFPSKSVTKLEDFLKLAHLSISEVMPRDMFEESSVIPLDIDKVFAEKFPKENLDPSKNNFKILYIDLSTYYSDAENLREYNVLEPPLGLMALHTYISKEHKGKVDGRIVKSKIDFDSHDELVNLIISEAPDLIGVRAMTFYKGLFHDACSKIRAANISIPIVVGGPYPTASYNEIVFDKNIDLVCVGEGESTLSDLIKAMIHNQNNLPSQKVLAQIPGLAFLGDGSVSTRRNRDPDDWKRVRQPLRFIKKKDDSTMKLDQDVGK